jgi:small subunit ribosomal protein S17
MTTNTKKQVLKGTVVSNKMQKTIVVDVSRYVQHPKYKKYYTINKKYKAHDEKSDANIGDVVEIESVKPISKDKKFALLNIVSRNKLTETK